MYGLMSFDKRGGYKTVIPKVPRSVFTVSLYCPPAPAPTPGNLQSEQITIFTFLRINI